MEFYSSNFSGNNDGFTWMFSGLNDIPKLRFFLKKFFLKQWFSWILTALAFANFCSNRDILVDEQPVTGLLPIDGYLILIF